ncbi:hypothetical protein G3A49_13455 [Haloferax volcanii]|jgi:hypothetical protein|uniref:Small CPxCG-related zinc finger protein n=2 Tax=Haloferax volcanii TaxID=2246 RepID=D4H0G6_HALVD|nr:MULTISPECIES: hypothetical protein [Haloferax]ADE05245.1 small CPxCG-related zinc finger protein [Haloferax volcanii DS2]MBS8121298.1 hypothetical protein [Haloferax volcanii]MBS8126306.1 hypothetical protein [Haloferax volcanii]MBS8130176.1 hypothetical protein [Haloferax volcanii]MBS8134054.1 hypothetical protein [Haloferax volcanii]
MSDAPYRQGRCDACGDERDDLVKVWVDVSEDGDGKNYPQMRCASCREGPRVARDHPVVDVGGDA